MNEQQAFQHLLREKFLDLQGRNPHFSMRAFASKLDINPGALSYILNGKRNISRKMAEKLTARLLLDPQQRSEILRLFPLKKVAKNQQGLEPRYLELDAANFKVAAEWEHFAIMSLLNCKGFKNSTPSIAERLGLSLTRTSQAIERLINVGLIKCDEKGVLSRSRKSYRTSDDVASTSMKKHHDQTLELARTSLFRDSVTDRDFTTMTIAMNPKNMTKAKELIRKFHDDFSELLENDDPTEVYRLGMQFFPMTQK